MFSFRNRALTVLVLLSVFFMSAGSADAGSRHRKFGRPGGYISAGIGGATETFGRNFDSGLFDFDAGTAFLVGGRLGSRLNEFVAIDGSVDYSVSGFRVSAPALGSAEAKTLTAMGNLKLYPFAWQVQPYAMGGLGMLWGSLACADTSGIAVGCSVAGLPDSEIVFAGRAGGGIDVYLNRHVALTGEVAYVMPTGALKDLNYVSYQALVTFRF